MPLRERARPLWSLIVRHQPWSILGPLLVAQWLCLFVLAVSVEHNGWLYYQGGDQSYYWTDAHQLSEWTLPVAVVGYAWSYLLIPIAFFAGANVLSGLPVVIVLNALILLPVALLCVYGIATRIAGRIFGYWAAFLWVIVPYVTIPMFDQRYHEKYVDITLPQSLGLTVLGDFPSMVFLLLTAYLLVRALDTRDWTDAVLAGLTGGFAIGLKPSNSLFFGAAVLCLVVARRWTQTAAFAAALVPGVFLLALWKQRGLGELPAFSSTGTGGGGTLAAIGADAPLGSLLSPARRYVDLDWDQLQRNIDGVREFFWAVRPLEFVPFAGLLAIGRRSWPKGILVFGWFMTFLLIKGTDEKANIEDASFFRLLMPSFPAFLLLLASIPLLVPAFSWTRRVLPSPLPSLPSRRHGRRLLAAAAAVLVVLPLIFVAGTTPQSTAEAVTYRLQDVYVPVQSFKLKATRSSGRARLTWDAPYSGGTAVFYTVLRSRPVTTDPDNDDRKTVEGLSCKERAHDAPLSCDLVMDHLSTTATRRYVDRPPPGRWTYRVGMTANWVDDTSLGDVMIVSDPVTITG
jgi:hypothetical protein